MSLSFNPTAFDPVSGVVNWLAIMGIVLVVATIALLLASLVALGWPSGPLQILEYLRRAGSDLAGTSPRRIWALAVLTFREAFRRKTLMVFVVFAVLFLFAGWFISNVTDDADLQVKTYVSFVLRTISWLILPVVLLLACWGLPEDIKARSLHTVVTKPVRRHEVVLGRILGFTGIGALVLAVMGVVGYFWIVRELAPSMQPNLVARVPIYGTLVFVDSVGNETRAGINTGDENPFRSFVEGNTRARAVWEFQNITPERVGQSGNLHLESSFQSFRTHKGNIERELLCQLTLVNPATDRRVALKAFPVHEFRRNSYDVLAENPTGLQDADGKPVDLRADLLSSPTLRVEVACLSTGQFLGMARPDLFIRLPDRPFAASYFKSIGNIGLMMFMVIVLGVMSGCFLKGPVATLLTAFVVLVGRLSHGFMEEVATGQLQLDPRFELKSRGLLEGLIRIPTHKTPTVPLDDTVVNRVIQAIDSVELNGLWAIKHLFPNLSEFDTTEYTANAFDVPWAESILPNLAVTIGFCLPWIIIGYFSLQVRELEAK